MSHVVIPTNTPDATLRRVPLDLVDAVDLLTPEDIDVTDVKAQLSVAGADDVPSANELVQVDADEGEYYLEFDQEEINLPPGTKIAGWVRPTGCAKRRFLVEIAAAGLVTEPSSLEEIAAAVVAEAGAEGVALTDPQVAALTRAVFRAVHYADGYGARRLSGDSGVELVIPGDVSPTPVAIDTDIGRPTITEAGAAVT
jgi:hypothetical protein